MLQTDGLGMGAPTSAILPEAYIQNMFKYVADILIMYDQKETNIEEGVTEINKQEPITEFAI
jgi:hypothetical protein